MSSQKGNVSRSRAQKHQNAFAYKNNKYGATSQVKVANSKIHEGLCLHCKGVLEWKVKYNKYKSLTQPRKCVKCSEKTVKDAYHILCKPCSLQLEICCKCGKKEDIVVPINSDLDKEEPEEDGEQTEKGSERGKKDRDSDDDDDDDFDEDLDDKDDEDFDKPEEDCEQTEKGRERGKKDRDSDDDDDDDDDDFGDLDDEHDEDFDSDLNQKKTQHEIHFKE